MKRATSGFWKLAAADLLFCHRFMRAAFDDVERAGQKLTREVDWSVWHLALVRRTGRVDSPAMTRARFRKFVGRVWSLREHCIDPSTGRLAFWELFSLLPADVDAFELLELLYHACVRCGADPGPERAEFDRMMESVVGRELEDAGVSTEDYQLLSRHRAFASIEDARPHSRHGQLTVKQPWRHRLTRYVAFVGLPDIVFADTQANRLPGFKPGRKRLSSMMPLVARVGEEYRRRKALGLPDLTAEDIKFEGK